MPAAAGGWCSGRSRSRIVLTGANVSRGTSTKTFLVERDVELQPRVGARGGQIRAPPKTANAMGRSNLSLKKQIASIYEVIYSAGRASVLWSQRCPPAGRHWAKCSENQR